MKKEDKKIERRLSKVWFGNNGRGWENAICGRGGIYINKYVKGKEMELEKCGW